LPPKDIKGIHSFESSEGWLVCCSKESAQETTMVAVVAALERCVAAGRRARKRLAKAWPRPKDDLTHVIAGRKENHGMKRAKIAHIILTGVAFLLIAFASSTLAQTRDPRLADSQQPGSVIVFPKFIRGFVPVDGAAIPATEFEVGVVCPKGSSCPERQQVKIRFHYVCGSNEGDIPNSFVCRETDFDAFVTVNGKLVFNPEATTPPGNLLTPSPSCTRGYLIGWVIDVFDRPIKFDGLIGDAVFRESPTAVSAYSAIPIQAHPDLATGALITVGGAGNLVFDGAPGHYQALTGVIFGDVAYDQAPRRVTKLTLLTLNVRSNRPNYPTFVDINFYNAQEALLSTFTEFICWGEKQLSTEIDGNLTQPGIGSRKGVFVTEAAEKVPIFGLLDTAGPVTLLGLVTTLEGPTGTERQYSYGVFNDSEPVSAAFRP
jgi:hypothetical protein